ncbi:hypothetical protein, partial [Gordonia sp. UBA7599]|uniref:hypothetical protein n=1 Tax=Gordonia sp. UBA7599 TaxID=1946578 RepID=UPI0039C86E29
RLVHRRGAPGIGPRTRRRRYVPRFPRPDDAELDPVVRVLAGPVHLPEPCAADVRRGGWPVLLRGLRRRPAPWR